MSAEIDRFLATGDAAKKKKPAPATIRRVGLRCTNCGGSHNTRDCPYEKKQGGLHNDDGTKIRVCSVCHIERDGEFSNVMLNAADTFCSPCLWAH